jgi:hypothetical protein
MTPRDVPTVLVIDEDGARGLGQVQENLKKPTAILLTNSLAPTQKSHGRD